MVVWSIGSILQMTSAIGLGGDSAFTLGGLMRLNARARKSWCDSESLIRLVSQVFTVHLTSFRAAGGARVRMRLFHILEFNISNSVNWQQSTGSRPEPHSGRLRDWGLEHSRIASVSASSKLNTVKSPLESLLKKMQTQRGLPAEWKLPSDPCAVVVPIGSWGAVRPAESDVIGVGQMRSSFETWRKSHDSRSISGVDSKDTCWWL